MSTCPCGDSNTESSREELTGGIKPATGPSELPHETQDITASKCSAATPVIEMYQKQKTVLTLYVVDSNGQPIDLSNIPVGSSSSSDESSIIFEARDRSGDATPRLRKSCTLTDAATGKVQCELVTNDTRTLVGILEAQVLVYGAGSLYYASPYWLMIKPSLDSALGIFTHDSPLTLAEVRLLLRDQCGSQNVLLNDFEFDDSQIIACMRHPIDEFNEAYQPTTRYSTRNFPFRFHWLRAVCGYLLEIAAHGYARDHLPYSAGGVSVDDKNKAATYINIAKALLAEWRQFIASKKIELNIAGGFGRTGSAYGTTYYR